MGDKGETMMAVHAWTESTWKCEDQDAQGVDRPRDPSDLDDVRYFDEHGTRWPKSARSQDAYNAALHGGLLGKLQTADGDGVWALVRHGVLLADNTPKS